MSLCVSATENFCVAIDHYAKYCAGIPWSWLQHISGEEKDGLHDLEEITSAFRGASTHEAEIFGNVYKDLEKVEETWLKAHTYSRFDPRNLWGQDIEELERQSKLVRELAETRFGIGFGAILQFKEYEPTVFLSKLHAYTETFAHLENNFCPQDELGVFIHTFCEIAKRPGQAQILLNYADSCTKFSDEDLSIRELSKAFAYYSIYLRAPDPHRIHVNYGPIEKELPQLSEAVRDYEIRIKTEVEEEKKKSTPKGTVIFLITQVGKLIIVPLLELLSKL